MSFGNSKNVVYIIFLINTKKDNETQVEGILKARCILLFILFFRFLAVVFPVTSRTLR